MRKLVIFIMFCFIGNKAISQNINLNENEIPKILCQTWKFDYALLAGNKISGFEKVQEKYIFKTDGTYHMFSSDSLYKSGKWNYNQKEKYIEMQNETNSDVKKISFLSPERIVVLHKIKLEIQGRTIENTEFYFKPE
jgi:hypothetical protein